MSIPPRGLFITGTDTDVGKTVASACLVRIFTADYWKPIQTGCSLSDDSVRVKYLSGVHSHRIHPCLYCLQAPLAPHEAARQEGVQIILDRFKLPQSARPIIVEGAGGVFVPLNEHYLMIDLMVRLCLPVILVARSSLGTINHTLLSLSALRKYGLTVSVVIINGPPNFANRVAIEKYGRITVKELPWICNLNHSAIKNISDIISLEYIEI